MIYKILGKPIALKRPRTDFIRRRVYDCQRPEKDDAILQLRLQHKQKPAFDGPLNLTVTFFMLVPASSSLKKKLLLYNQPHIKAPDLSNLLKFVEDVIVEAQIITDDSKIISISAKKLYAEYPRTEFQITKEGCEKS